MIFPANPEQAFLFLEGMRLRNAYQFDPLYGVSVSNIDLLPHQIEAIYYRILANPRIRFLLTDDPGAGKTIMAGLLFKELKYRGLVHRTLVIVPGHLKQQWIREMKERFGESFLIVDRGVLNANWGQNAPLAGIGCVQENRLAEQYRGRLARHGSASHRSEDNVGGLGSGIFAHARANLDENDPPS